MMINYYRDESMKLKTRISKKLVREMKVTETKKEIPKEVRGYDEENRVDKRSGRGQRGEAQQGQIIENEDRGKLARILTLC